MKTGGERKDGGGQKTQEREEEMHTGPFWTTQGNCSCNRTGGRDSAPTGGREKATNIRAQGREGINVRNRKDCFSSIQEVSRHPEHIGERSKPQCKQGSIGQSLKASIKEN